MIFLTSCKEDHRIYEKNTDIEGAVWQRAEAKFFDFVVEDTATYYKIIYNLRNDADYLYYNLYLKFQLMDSTGTIIDDQLHDIALFDPRSGKPNGSSRYIFGYSLDGIYDHRYMLYDKIKFREQGTYRISARQFMREQEYLDDILSIGLRVEKIQE